MQTVHDYDPKSYVIRNWTKLITDPLMRRIMNSIRYNKLFTLNVQGPRGAGKSTAQRWISYLTYGDWDLVMNHFRIQTKEQFEGAIAFAKSNPAFWMPYGRKGEEPVENLKRLWLADIDDKATLFPSSVGQTKEMSAWHVRDLTIRSSVCTIVGSAPDTSDIRKRMRIGAIAEMLVVPIELPNGEEIPEARFYRFNHHSKWHDAEGKYISKTLMMRYHWPQLPSDVLKMELRKREELGNKMATKTQTYAQLEGKLDHLVGKNGVLFNTDMEIIEGIWENSKHGGFALSSDINNWLKEKYGVERTGKYLSRTLDNLVDLGLIKHLAYPNGGNSKNELTELGQMVFQHFKTLKETREQLTIDQPIIKQGKVKTAELSN